MNTHDMASALTDEEIRAIGDRDDGSRYSPHHDSLPTALLRRVTQVLYPETRFFVSLKPGAGYWKKSGLPGWPAQWDDEVWYFNQDGFQTNWYGSSWCNAIVFGVRPATPGQIAAYEEKRRQVQAKRSVEIEAVDALLARCDLKRSDFVRFRGASIDGDRLTVETRENGIGERSVRAIRSPHYLESFPDRGDFTYEYYVFRVPPNGITA